MIKYVEVTLGKLNIEKNVGNKIRDSVTINLRKARKVGNI